MKFNQFKYTSEEGESVVVTVETDTKTHVLTPYLKDVDVKTAEDVRSELKKLLAGEKSRLERLTEEREF